MKAPREGVAVVLSGFAEPVQLEPILLDPPGPHEVQVRLVASGVCHTDLHLKRSGGMGMPLPIILGHEGAGYIEEVGKEVVDLAPGDPVIVAWRAPCGNCPACRRGDPRRCWTPLEPEARLRRQRDGAPLSRALRTGTFATRTVIRQEAAVKIRMDVPLRTACLIACAVSTGIGTVFNTAQVWPGSAVAVIGCGAVGLNVVLGARLAHARQVIGIDIAARHLDWAREFGATDLVDASAVDPVARVRGITGGSGVDYAFDAVGTPECLYQATGMLGHAGTAVLIGVPASDAIVKLPLQGTLGLFENKAALMVSHGGDPLPRQDFPNLVDLYWNGELPLDRMVSNVITLDQVEEAFALMERGEVIRSVVEIAD